MPGQRMGPAIGFRKPLVEKGKALIRIDQRFSVRKKKEAKRLRAFAP